MEQEKYISSMQNAIKTRSSRRKYIPEPLDQSDVKILHELIAEYNAKENLDIRLVLDNGDAFKGFRKSYGMFSGVKNYIGLIGNKNDVLNNEKLGYYGELLILNATNLGLGTCWVGGTFDRRSCPFNLADGESIICVITVGKVSPELSGKEKFIRKLANRKSKSFDEMYQSDEPVPEWFISGMESVMLAPSAVNRQPVVFNYSDGNVTASVKDIAGEGYALDLGIAKLHFEIGAGGGTWDFGNGAGFVIEDIYDELY